VSTTLWTSIGASYARAAPIVVPAKKVKTIVVNNAGLARGTVRALSKRPELISAVLELQLPRHKGKILLTNVQTLALGRRHCVLNPMSTVVFTLEQGIARSRHDYRPYGSTYRRLGRQEVSPALPWVDGLQTNPATLPGRLAG
jgi:hypothetical protein